MLVLAGVAAPASAPAAQSALTSNTLALPAGAGQLDELTELLEFRRAAAARADRATRPKRTATPHTMRRRGPESGSMQHRPRHTTPPRRPHHRHHAVPAVPAGGGRARAIVAFALTQIGKPYVWAADGPGSFDCSGLVMAAYATVGIKLPHFTGGIAGLGRRVTRGGLLPGDIVFPSRHHVGIYIGRGRMVHAPHTGDHVRVSRVYAFWSARRLL